jgi:hypothetical protein
MENMQIQNNLITALQDGIGKIFLGSSCVFIQMAAQPLKEEYLLVLWNRRTNGMPSQNQLT